MIPLKYNTASQEIPLGYFVDSTDGNTEETALTIANTDIKLWKSGATTLANKNSGGATHISNGIYYCTLDATDTNTYGPLKIFVHVAGALTVVVECVVMNAGAYDALYAANGTGGVDISATAVDDVWDETISGHLTTGTTGLYAALAGGILVDTTITGTPTSTTLQLTAGSAVDDFYNDQLLYIISGTGIGQVRVITTYVGSTKTITIDEAFATTPAASDRIIILSSHVHPVTQIRDAILSDSTAFNGADIASILADTNELQVAHTNGNLGSDIDKINGVTITGDGSATPFNV